jgi:hypothetical protein
MRLGHGGEVSNGCHVWVDDEELSGRHDESIIAILRTFENAILHVYYM